MLRNSWPSDSVNNIEWVNYSISVQVQVENRTVCEYFKVQLQSTIAQCVDFLHVWNAYVCCIHTAIFFQNVLKITDFWKPISLQKVSKHHIFLKKMQISTTSPWIYSGIFSHLAFSDKQCQAHLKNFTFYIKRVDDM